MGPKHHGKAVVCPSTLGRDEWAPKGSLGRDVGDPGDHGKEVAELEVPVGGEAMWFCGKTAKDVDDPGRDKKDSEYKGRKF